MTDDEVIEAARKIVAAKGIGWHDAQAALLVRIWPVYQAAVAQADAATKSEQMPTYSAEYTVWARATLDTEHAARAAQEKQ